MSSMIELRSEVKDITLEQSNVMTEIQIMVMDAASIEQLSMTGSAKMEQKQLLTTAKVSLHQQLPLVMSIG